MSKIMRYANEIKRKMDIDDVLVFLFYGLLFLLRLHTLQEPFLKLWGGYE